MPRALTLPILAALACAASGCSLPATGWRAEMAATEKACVEGARAMRDGVAQLQRGTLSLNELKAQADADAAACAANETAWRTMASMPDAVRAACLPVAEGRNRLAQGMRAQLDHPWTEQDPDGVDARLDQLKRDAEACRRAGARVLG